MKNYPIKIETGEHAGETVWVHRSIAVAGFIFCKINNEWCVWVAGCTIQNVDTEVYIEEYSADVENEVSPDEDILENGFSRQVTFYEKD